MITQPQNYQRRNKLADAFSDIILLPALNVRSGFKAGYNLHNLKKSEWWPRESIENLQHSKLKSLLSTAYENVPFYRSQIKHQRSGARANNAREILAQLPILTKNDIRSAGDSLRDTQFKQVFKATTGGTTGEPLVIWRNRDAVSIAEALLWRGKGWAGIKPWHKEVHVFDFGKGTWYGRLRMRLLRKWAVDAFPTDPKVRRDIVNLISSVRPRAVEGFVTGLLKLAGEKNLQTQDLVAVFTTGEMLYESQKTALSEAFLSPVYSYYGSNEINSIAFECEYGTKHVSDEHVIVEVVNEQGQAVWDQPGRLLVTDLDNYAMPLIRYDLGDIATLTTETCRCGRHLMVLKELHGRRQDSIKNNEGEQLSATYFAGQFKELKFTGQIQLVQHDLYSVEILYEGDEKKAAAELDCVATTIQSKLGQKMKVWATKVDKIPLTPSGKCLLIRGIKT